MLLAGADLFVTLMLLLPMSSAIMLSPTQTCRRGSEPAFAGPLCQQPAVKWCWRRSVPRQTLLGALRMRGGGDQAQKGDALAREHCAGTARMMPWG